MAERAADLFAIGVRGGSSSGGDGAASAVAGTTRITMPAAGGTPTVEIFAGDAGRVQAHRDLHGDLAIYLWGRASHSERLQGGDLLSWCARAAIDRRPESLRKLIGNFVLIVDDRQRKRVTFASDVLGVRPWFFGAHDGRLVAGSNVLALAVSGLTSRDVDYDAIASWLLYNFNCSGGSVVAGLRRLDAGAVCTFDAGGRIIDDDGGSPRRHAPIRFQNCHACIDRLVDSLHQRVSHTFDQALCNAGDDEVNLPLSGGYDSRYLCALAIRRGRPRVRLTTVATAASELAAARLVAEALRLPLRIIDLPRRRVFDLFDDPFAFGGDGFPVARNLTAAVARLHRGMSVLSGFMGDVLMRAPVNASLKRFLALDNAGLDDAQLADAAHERYRIRTNRLDLLREPIARRATERARSAMRRIIEIGRLAGRPLAFSNLYLRHRLYFAGVFLGHLDVAEAILPFYSWDLIEYSTAHYASFQTENYAMLFRRHFPELAHVPHDSQIQSPPLPRAKRCATAHLRAWSADLLRSAFAADARRSAIAQRKLLRRLPSGLLAEPQHELELMFLHKVRLFERRARQAGLRLEWDAM